jgi:hypothetical protein
MVIYCSSFHIGRWNSFLVSFILQPKYMFSGPREFATIYCKQVHVWVIWRFSVSGQSSLSDWMFNSVSCNLWFSYGHIWSVLEYSNLWDAWQVDSVLGDKLPNTEDMKNLKYTTRVINEVSRTFLASSHEFCKLFWFGQVADMYKLNFFCPWQSLRLYPQPPVLIRRSLESDVLGKYPIKK